jgi:hypothetical protein
MNRRSIVIVVFILIIGVVFLLWPTKPTRVVGTISRDDLREVERIMRNELRSTILPKGEWDDLLHPKYVIESIREYQAQRILWVEVLTNGDVEVYAGTSTNVIKNEGHVITLHKNSTWETRGEAYWASSNVAPADINVPPSE